MIHSPQHLIVYKITYLPWVDNTLGKPWMYIGSTSRDLVKYFGSVGSKEFKEFWNNEVKLHPEHFNKEIILNCIIDSKVVLLELEENIQREYNVVKSTKYFNKNYATHRGIFGRCVEGEANPMFGVKRSDEWKVKHKDIMQEISDRPEIKIARSISQTEIQNRPEVKESKSVYQKKRWESNDIGVQRNKDAWCPKMKVHFQDFVFLSVTDFFKFIKENKYSSILSRLYKEYNHLRLIDLEIIQRNINMIGLSSDYDIFDVKNILELDKVKISKYKKTRFMSDMTRISFNIVPRILKKFRGKTKEIDDLLTDIKTHNVKFSLISTIGATS